MLEYKPACMSDATAYVFKGRPNLGCEHDKMCTELKQAARESAKAAYVTAGLCFQVHLRPRTDDISNTGTNNLSDSPHIIIADAETRTQTSLGWTLSVCLHPSGSLCPKKNQYEEVRKEGKPCLNIEHDQFFWWRVRTKIEEITHPYI